MLLAENLTVSLARREILRGVSLCCLPGTLTAIVGPNGSGKTTLLRALTGDLPYGGSASLNGHEIRDTPAPQLAARRGVLAQSTQLAFPFTVLEVVRLGLVNGGDETRARQALAEVGLAGFAGQLVQDLSGGEQARVQLARVLAQIWEPVSPAGPRWLFLDEPVAALDIGQQLAVMRLARRFADAGGGVVAVMHDLNLSAMFADRVALIHGGRLLAHGRAAEVLTDRHLETAYCCALRVNTVPMGNCPWLVPQAVAG
ncbi:heme ABC transporter ATP-binding protein [Szabonella alba]|uniref:Heme ABC transporter ATP-binding protein n=1 Tax=Szabonella alba TaxID=2804194 RepID=A0A8K0Y0A2_9RHOB|nr:heme ABC transporter ATP-binding protein [Szabonella alba]MBL4916908.1 heme ABC transporter ATP-binding protein [Szabonella alba]